MLMRGTIEAVTEALNESLPLRYRTEDSGFVLREIEDVARDKQPQTYSTNARKESLSSVMILVRFVGACVRFFR